MLQFFFFALFLALSPGAYAAEENSKFLSADDAYSKVQSIRSDSEKLVITSNWEPESIKLAISNLEKGIRFLDEPTVIQLASGYEPLFYRGLDLRLDLAFYYLKLGERNRSLDYLEQINSLFWLPDLEKYLDQRGILPGLKDEPRLRHILAVSRIPTALYSENSIPFKYKVRLSDAERVSGLSTYWTQVRSDFVYFDKVPELSWGKVYLEYLKKVLAAKTTLDYYKVMMTLPPLLKDGHTNIYPPKELYDRFYAKPPIQTRLIGERVLVTNVESTMLSHKLSIGDEILAIDGLPVKKYVAEKVLPFISSSTPQDTSVRAFGYHLLQGDSEKSVLLRVRSISGKTHDLRIARKGYEKKRGAPQSAFQMLPSNIAYLQINDFSTDESVRVLKDGWEKVMHSSGLIIDVRKNGGGSSTFGVQILGLLKDTPIEGIKSTMRGDNALSREDGNAVSWKALSFSGTSIRPRSSNVFKGPTILLTGPETFSAAEDFVALFKQSKRGVTVGGATGGSTGLPVLVQLPGGGFGRICAKRDTLIDGTSFVGSGLAPDVEVTVTPEDVFSRRDPVLERAIAVLQERTVDH